MYGGPPCQGGSTGGQYICARLHLLHNTPIQGPVDLAAAVARPAVDGVAAGIVAVGTVLAVDVVVVVLLVTVGVAVETEVVLVVGFALVGVLL
jgi:hypothetical protein